VSIDTGLEKSALWQLEVCNACRYCEGYCAVFPALERRRAFSPGDLQYLANLCFDCRACFYACMYAPPHEFGVNIPNALARVRRETYRQHALPALARRLGRQWRGLTVTIVAAGLLLLAAIALSGDFSRLFSVQTGGGAFYRVLPYVLMWVPALLFCGAAVTVLVIGVLRFHSRDERSTT
jgi:citrate/tricarballylate utilization protein